MELDLTDKRILCALDLDCREPLARLARRLRVNRNVVAYRIARLEKEGIISHYICSLNLGRLGYKTYKVLFKVESAGEQAFVAKALADARVIHCLKTEGAYDYSLSIAARSLTELDDLLLALKEYVRDYSVTIVVYSRIFKLEKLLLGEKHEAPKVERYAGEETRVLLDEKDERILGTLAQEANLPVVEIARRTGLSVDIVQYRLRQLKKSVIISNRIMLDTAEIGYTHYVLLLRMRTATQEDERRLVAWCALEPHVLYLSKKIGPADFDVNLAARTVDELTQFLGSLKAQFGPLIDSYDLVINTGLLKLNYVPFGRDATTRRSLNKISHQ